MIACSRETPAPQETATARPATADPAAVSTAAGTPPSVNRGTYEEAMVWFRSNPGFRFVLTEGGVRAEGELQRETVGAEVISVRANGEEWRAEAGPKGVTWKRGGAEAPAPAWGSRLYQRVTVAFDPQKVEGDAQLVPGEAGVNHYRFTNANTGEVHDVWVDPADAHIRRMKIGDAVEMTIEK